MQDRLTFEYAIIRIVPKVEREEFFNAGVILFSKQKKFLGIKFEVNPKKLSALSSEIELDVLNTYLKAWQLICEGDPLGGTIGRLDLPDRFRWLTACRSTIIQSSKTHNGLSNDLDKALNDIFEQHVL